MRKPIAIKVLAAMALFSLMGAGIAHGQIYSPTQAQLLALTDENPGFGGTGVVNSVVADANGGVIVTFTFGSTGTAPQPAFDDTFFGPNLNLSGFTNLEVNVTLLPGSGTDNVDVQQFVQGGSSDGFFFAQHDVNPVSIAGGTTLANMNLTSSFSGATPPGAPTDAIRVGFQVFPPSDQAVPGTTAPDMLEIDPVPAPEPAALSLSALALSGLFIRRRRAI